MTYWAILSSQCAINNISNRVKLATKNSKLAAERLKQLFMRENCVGTRDLRLNLPNSIANY
jgi:hypothetical protein